MPSTSQTAGRARRRSLHQGKIRTAGVAVLVIVSAPGLAWAQTRLTLWPLGLCLALAALLAASLMAVLVLHRQLARNTDQFAAVCSLIASLDRTARGAETRGTEALDLAAQRLETILTESETTFRDDGSTLRATVRYLESQGATHADLLARLEALALALPQRQVSPALDAAGPESAPSLPGASPGQLKALIDGQSGRHEAAVEALQNLQALAQQLPIQSAACAARLDAQLADAVTRRLGLFEAVGAAITRLIERADSTAGLGRLEAVAARLDTAAALVTPLYDAVTRLETTAGLPPLLTRLIEQAHDAQSDLIAHASIPQPGTGTMRPELVASLEALSALPPLIVRLTEEAGEANVALNGAASNIAAKITEAAAGIASVADSVSHLQALRGVPAQLAALADAATAAQASLATTASDAATQMTGASETLGSFSGCVARLETLSRLPAQLNDLAEKSAAALADCNVAVAGSIDTFGKLSDSISQLESLSALPAELERLAGTVAAAEAGMTAAAASAAERIAHATDSLSPLADNAGQLGALSHVPDHIAQMTGKLEDAISVLARTGTGLAAAADGSLAALQFHTASLGSTAAELAEAKPVLSELCTTLAAIPAQLGVSLAGFAHSQSAEQDRFSAALARQQSEAATTIESLAARADAALAALPAEADLIAAMLEGGARSEARLSEATDRLETAVASQVSAPAGLDPVLNRLDGMIARLEALPQTPETLEAGLTDLRAAIAGLSAPPVPPAWLPRLAELETILQDVLAALRARDSSADSVERAAAGLTAAVTETMGHGYAQLHRLDTILSRAAQPPSELLSLPAMIGDLRAALTAQQSVAQEVQRAAAEAATAATLALSQGEAHQNTAERLLAAAEAAREAATPRGGLSVIPGLAITCRSLATDLGLLARGGSAPAGLAENAPVLLAALQQGADDLRTAATALALARDALPNAA